MIFFGPIEDKSVKKTPEYKISFNELGVILFVVEIER